MATATRSKHSKLDAVQINQGLTVVYPDPDEPRKLSNEEISVDIIAVPGLGANPEWTWKNKNKVDWLRDSNMLARTTPNARILIFEYESQWFGKGSIDQRLASVANQLVQAVLYSRPRGSTRPIVFVCHCLGGIIVEKALLTAKLRQSDYPNIFMSAVGCIFLGTPFRGTKSQSKASLLADMAQTVGLGINSGLVKLLEGGSETLKDLLDDFVAAAKEANMRLFCFFEQHESDMMRLLSKSSPIKHKEIIVEEDSATFPGFNHGSLASDHFELNKFNGPKDGRYISVSSEISATVQKARGILKSRQNAVRQTLIDDGTYQTILDALKVTDPAKDKDDSVRGRPISQAKWVLGNENYMTWKDKQASKVLWIHGTAGQGQAVIASSLVQELSEQPKKDDSIFLAYFFCDEKDSHRRSILDILKVLIRQMILRKRDLTEYLLVDQRKVKKGDQSSQNLEATSVSALWNNLQNMLKDPSIGTVYFLVNGLDETDQESREEFLSSLVPYLETQPDEESTSEESIIKWVFLSRSGRPDIEAKLQKGLVINMEDKENVSHVNDAVKAEISGQVDKLAQQKSYNAALAYFIKRHIHSRAEGNYIYVNLVIQELKNLETTRLNNSGIRKFLEGFPYGLTNMFEHIRRRVLDPQSEGIEYTKEIFRCLILAHRSPTLFELALIADLPQEDRNDETSLRRYITRCGAFVTISEIDNETVEWIDVAAKEHLETYAKDQLSLSLTDVQHGIVALRCLDFVRKYAIVQKEEEADEEPPDNQEEPDQPDLTPIGQDASNTQVDEKPIEEEDYLSQGDQTQTYQASSYSDEYPQQGRQPFLHQAQTYDGQGYDGWPDPEQDYDNQGHEHQNDSFPPHIDALNDKDQVIDGQEDPGQPGPTENNRQAELASNSGEIAASEVPEEIQMDLGYAGECWIQHAKLAPVDVVEEFNLNDEFWVENSRPRNVWWSAYALDNGLAGLADVTTLHIGALSGFSALVDHLLLQERTDEIHKSDSWGFRPFYWACRNGDIYLVQRLLKAGSDVNAHRHDGNITALWIAASEGHLEVVRYLLSQNAELDVQDEELGTPLYVAAENGCSQVVRQLLEHQADVNLAGGLHRNPLNAASYNGHLEVVQLLLQAHAEVDPEEEYRYGSALGASARKGHVDIVRLLLQKGWNANRKIGTYGSPIVAAATYGHADVVQALLEQNVDTSSKEQALEIASKNGKTDVVKKLLEQSNYLRHQKAFLLAASFGRDDVLELLQTRGTNPDMLNNALYEASDHEHESTVDLLVKFGANPDAEGVEYGTALTAAAFDGSEGIVQILLDHGANVNKQGGNYGNALQAAACCGNVDVARKLLDHGAHVNREAIGIYGNALQAACYSGSGDLVDLLLTYGADVNAYGGTYGYPIIAAVDECDSNVLRKLLEHGADVNVKGSEDNTPVLVLAGYGLLKDDMELLLHHGAEIDIVDDCGNTALIATASSGDTEGIEFLLDRGANIHAVSSEYGAALHAAASEGDEECLRILISRGANVNQEGGPWNTSLQAAAIAADLDCIRMLIDAGADVNLGGGDYDSALQAAAFSGDLECLQAILAAGADVSHGGGKYGSALQAAAIVGEPKCLQVLLEAGSDVNQAGGLYGSALQAAVSKNRNIDCVELLLDHGATVHAYGGLYGSVMQAAAVGNNLNMWGLLVDNHGADAHVVGGKYGNALQAAAVKATDDFVLRLLESSVDVSNEVGGKYNTALQAAAYANRPEVVTMLLEHGADVSIQGGFYGNALTAAACKGNTRVLSLLLVKSLPTNILDEALLQAVHHRQAGVVEMLLKHGANVEARDETLGSALDAIQKEFQADTNSDDGGDGYEEEDSDDDDDDDDDDDEEDEGEAIEEIVPDVQDNDASVASLQLGDPTTEESKILKLLEDAQTKLKRNPSVKRVRSVRRKPVSPNPAGGNGKEAGVRNHAQYLNAEPVAGSHPFHNNTLQASQPQNPQYSQHPIAMQPQDARPMSSSHEAYGSIDHIPRPQNTKTSSYAEYGRTQLQSGQAPSSMSMNSNHTGYGGGVQVPPSPALDYSQLPNPVQHQPQVHDGSGQVPQSQYQDPVSLQAVELPDSNYHLYGGSGQIPPSQSLQPQYPVAGQSQGDVRPQSSHHAYSSSGQMQTPQPQYPATGMSYSVELLDSQAYPNSGQTLQSQSPKPQYSPTSSHYPSYSGSGLITPSASPHPQYSATAGPPSGVERPNSTHQASYSSEQSPRPQYPHMGPSQSVELPHHQTYGSNSQVPQAYNTSAAIPQSQSPHPQYATPGPPQGAEPQNPNYHTYSNKPPPPPSQSPHSQYSQSPQPPPARPQYPPSSSSGGGPPLPYSGASTPLPPPPGSSQPYQQYSNTPPPPPPPGTQQGYGAQPQRPGADGSDFTRLQAKAMKFGSSFTKKFGIQ